MKEPVQNTNLNIRISKELRDKFVAISNSNNTPYSKLIREFIINYVKNGKIK